MFWLLRWYEKRNKHFSRALIESFPNIFMVTFNGHICAFFHSSNLFFSLEKLAVYLMGEFWCTLWIFHKFDRCVNSHTGARNSITFAGGRIRTVVCGKKLWLIRSIGEFRCVIINIHPLPLVFSKLAHCPLMCEKQLLLVCEFAHLCAKNDNFTWCANSQTGVRKKTRAYT